MRTVSQLLDSRAGPLANRRLGWLVVVVSVRFLRSIGLFCPFYRKTQVIISDAIMLRIFLTVSVALLTKMKPKSRCSISDNN